MGMENKINLFKVHMPESVLEPLKQVLFSGYIGQGIKVEEFERILGEYIGNKLVLTLNSCTSAIQLALRLCNIGVGDEVISTAMTCTATNEPILAMGAKIVWADIDPTTGNIDPKSIEKKITNKTKAIIVVHWGGYPPDLKEINEKPGYSLLVNTGMYVIQSAVLKIIPKNTYYLMTDLIQDAKGSGLKVGVYPISEKSWIDVGQWEEYRKALVNLNLNSF